MNDALETLYALRIMYWIKGMHAHLAQINRDIRAIGGAA